MERFFSFKGRLRRKNFAIRSLILVIPFIIANVIVKTSEDTIHLLIALIILIPMGVSATSLTIRRLHDINLGGWFCLINFIPFVNFIFALYEIFKEGTVGPNQYGEDPKTMINELNAA